MKKSSDWLIPGFLRRWDQYLLENYPLLWRTRGLYVLYFALLLIPVFFAAGFFWRVSADKLTVDPIEPVVLGEDLRYIIPLILLGTGILYWGYTQFQARFPTATLAHVFLTLVIYAGCFFVLTAVTAPAFRMGTIVRTAYFFMEEADVDYWERHNYFLYGHAPKDSADATLPGGISGVLLDSFFTWRASELKIKQKLLDERYDLLFMDRVAERFSHDQMDYVYAQHYLPYLTRQSTGPSDLARILYTEKDFPTDMNSSYLRVYYPFYEKNIRPQINTGILEKYKIPLVNDTVSIGSGAVIRPQYLCTMEDAVRSVRHARQYLKEGILFRHWRVTLFFLPLLCLLLFSAPYLAFRPALEALVVAMAGTALNAGFSLDSRFSAHWYYWHSTAYLLVPVAGLLLLLVAFLQQKRTGYVAFGFHLLVTGMATVLFFALFGDEWVFSTAELFFGKPVDLAFFSVQAIGFAGVLLLARLQALPKR